MYKTEKNHHHRQVDHSSGKNGIKMVAKAEKEESYKLDIVWFNVVWYVVLHTLASYGLFLMLTGRPQWKTTVWVWSFGFVCIQGITTGAHRLWTHRTYKAKLPFKLLLFVLNTIMMQNSIYIWARDHRIHHKFTDTDADPHNSKRGFFFSHMGWLLVKKHKDVIEKGKSVDFSDLEDDPMVMFQHKYYLPLALFWGLFFPVWVPMYFWKECFAYAFILSMFRYTALLHGTWCINSVAHMFGTKPYDTTISSVQNLAMAVMTGGEGWHNYHHVFPWDYKTDEFGFYFTNSSAGLIDFMAAIGWAYDLQTTSPEMIRQRQARTGGGSRNFGDQLVYQDSVMEGKTIGDGATKI